MNTDVGVVELHLSPVSMDRGAIDMPARFGSAITSLGGDYNQCRGYHTTRFVKLPMTVEGIDLAVDLLRFYANKRYVSRFDRTVEVMAPTTVVLRGGTSYQDSFADVLKVDSCEQAERLFYRAWGKQRGVVFAAAEKTAERQAQESAARPGKLREERARLLARLAEIDAELAS